MGLSTAPNKIMLAKEMKDKMMQMIHQQQILGRKIYIPVIRNESMNQ